MSNQLPVHTDTELESFKLIQSQLERLFDSVFPTHFNSDSRSGRQFESNIKGVVATLEEVDGLVALSSADKGL